MMGRDYRQQQTRAANLLKVTKALQECPKSVSEICTETGVSGTTVSRLCKELRDSGGAYIAMYEQNRSDLGGRVVARNWHGCKDAAPANKTGTPGTSASGRQGRKSGRTSIDRFDPLRDYRGFLKSGPAQTFRHCPDRST